jgi:hypothetical protein
MADEARETRTPSPRAPRLNTLGGVRRELARLYSDLRSGAVPPRVAGTGGYLLSTMIKALEVEQLEDRLNRLEEQVRQEDVDTN